MGEATPGQRADASLTEREKITLRLLLAGHDAKSIARELGLSVHTVNERLRDARRKLGAASSREAARRLADYEAHAPQKLRDDGLGVPTPPPSMDSSDQAERRPQRLHRLAWFSGGMLIMSLLIAAAIAGFVAHRPAPSPIQAPAAPVATVAAEAESMASARAWLVLVDQGKWEDSWRTASTLFRQQVTAERWTGMVTPARQPLGKVVSRTLLGVEKTKVLPGAPAGEYEVLKFRTSFAQRADAIETLVLVREGSGWGVTGYLIQ